MSRRISFSVLFIFMVNCCFTSCEEPYAPKPRGYFRIALPERSYAEYTPEKCPFTLGISKAAVAKIDSGAKASEQECWFNIEYPRYKATVYMSYRPVNGDLERLTEDCRQLAMKHVAKAAAIDEMEYADSERRVYGLFYDLKGNSASPVQFWITDSSRHFIRGSLYFYAIPNADSVAPVLSFIRDDLRNMAESLSWNR